MNDYKNKTVVITGGTDGIGAASAIELSVRGARVIIIGRSAKKADAVIAQSKTQLASGSIESVIADFSLMRNARQTAQQVASVANRIDILIHAVGILITRKEYTLEGMEKDFSVSYLSRFVFTEYLFNKGLLTPDTVMVNIAASGPRIPSFARMEFNNLDEVMARSGMKSHGQAQLANDIFTMTAAKRYGIQAIGYGPGSVDTSIRREIPRLLRWVMKPFFFFSTRTAQAVAGQLVEILNMQNRMSGLSYFFNKKGSFKPDVFINNPVRQNQLLETSIALSEKALNKVI